MRIVETVIAVVDQGKPGMANRIIDAGGVDVDRKTIAAGRHLQADDLRACRPSPSFGASSPAARGSPLTIRA